MQMLSVAPAWAHIRRYWLNLRRVRFWLLLVAALYVVGGFVVLPITIAHVAESTAEGDLDREFRVGSVRTNPFTLTLEIEDLALADIDGRRLLGFDRLFVDVDWSSVREGTLVVPTLRLAGAYVREEQFASGRTRLGRLAVEAQRRPLPRAGPRRSIIRPVEGGPSAPIALNGIDLAIDDFMLAADAVSSVRASGRFDLGGEFAFDGEVQLLPALDAAGDLRVEGLALALGEPFAQRFVDVRFAGGTVGVDGRVESGPDEPFAYTGSARSDGLDVVGRAGGEAVAGWQALTIDRVDVSLAGRRVETSVIQLDRPSGRVFIDQDGSTSIGRLLVERPPAPAAGDEAAPFGIEIGGIRFDDGRLAFSDRSAPLPFATRVDDLDGGISRLSPGQEEAARVELEGQVGDYGQARITGAINPWDPIRETRIDVLLENLDIPDYTPYAIPFAGRRIAAGRMDLDLGYVIEGGNLTARNNIVLRDLELGEKYEHPDAVNLPLGLAVALLKDSNGVITFDIPIRGDLEDPEFVLGPAIRKAVLDILTSIIKSPFSLLASLVGGDSEDLGEVAFAPGASEVAPPQRQRIDQLRRALDERPELIVELAGPYDPAVDRPALRRQKALAAMAARLAEAGIEVATPSLTDPQASAVLQAMYADSDPEVGLDAVRERFTRVPEANAEGGDGAEAEDGATPEFDAAAFRDHLAAQVVAAQTVTEAELTDLARTRAEAVRARVVRRGEDFTIAADRARVVEPVRVEADGAVVLEIGLAAD